MEIRRYLTGSGRDVFGEWLAGLRDARTQAKIVARIDRLSAGNCGDCKALRALVGRDRILLLCGGDKRRQPSDIKRALAYLKDYRERTP